MARPGVAQASPKLARLPWAQAPVGAARTGSVSYRLRCTAITAAVGKAGGARVLRSPLCTLLTHTHVDNRVNPLTEGTTTMPPIPGKHASTSPITALAALDWRSAECRFDRSSKEVLNFVKGEIVVDTLNDVSVKDVFFGICVHNIVSHSLCGGLVGGVRMR